MTRLPLLFLLALIFSPQTSLAYDHGSWAARVSDAAAAMEYWDLTARMDSGHFLFVRFLITNEGPGAHTAAGIGTLIQPDGTVVPFRYGRREGDWKLSPDKLVVDISSLTLDLSSEPRHFEMDSKKRGIKIHLNFTTPGPITWSEPSDRQSHHADLLELAAPIEGTIWVHGMTDTVTTRGRVSLSHAWMDQTESDLVQRQIEVFVQDGDPEVYATDLAAPTGEVRAWMALRDPNGRLLRGETAPVALTGVRPSPDPRAGYPLPETVHFADKQTHLVATVQRELLRVDPTEVIPQPFRLILTMKMQPLRIFADATCRLEREGLPSATRPCLVVVTYLNPLVNAPR